MAPIGGDVLLDCGFRQKDSTPGQDVALEWRLQHRGNGHKVLDMKAREMEAEVGSDGKRNSHTITSKAYTLNVN